MPASPADDRALGHRRLLAHAVGEVRVRPLQPLGDRPRARLDLRLELRVDDERPPGRAREQLDRPVVVGRPEAARDDEQVVPEPGLGAPPRARRGRRRRSASRPARSRARAASRARNGPLQVGAVAADELRAGDDDRGAQRGSARRARRSASRSSSTGFSPLSGTCLPPTLMREVLGRADADPEVLALERLGPALLDRPLRRGARPVGPVRVDGDVGARRSTALDLRGRRAGRATACTLRTWWRLRRRRRLAARAGRLPGADHDERDDRDRPRARAGRCSSRAGGCAARAAPTSAAAARRGPRRRRSAS